MVPKIPLELSRRLQRPALSFWLWAQLYPICLWRNKAKLRKSRRAADGDSKHFSHQLGKIRWARGCPALCTGCGWHHDAPSQRIEGLPKGIFKGRRNQKGELRTIPRRSEILQSQPRFRLRAR